MLTFAHLDTLVAISPDSFPNRGHFDARRGLARIAQAEGAELSTLDAAIALPLFERLRDRLPAKDFGNIRPNLVRALEISPLPLDALDRIRRGEPTLADAMLAVAHQPKLGKGSRVSGALEAFARILCLSPEQIPGKLAFVNEQFARWSPVLLKRSPEDFVNFRWRVRTGIRLVDIVARQQAKASRLTGAWAELARSVRDLKGRLAGAGSGWFGKLMPLVAYCNPHGIAPGVVSDDTIRALHADLIARGVANPLEKARNVVYAWEALQKVLPGFPKQKLNRVYKAGFGGESAFDVPFNMLSQEFRASWNEYIKENFGPYGLPQSFADIVPAGKTSFAKLAKEIRPIRVTRRRDTSVPNFRTTVTYAANVMIAAGNAPTNIAEIATAETLGGVIDAVMERQQARGDSSARTANLYGTATRLISIARDVGAPSEEIEAMLQLRDRVDPHFIKYVRGRKKDGSEGIIRVRQDWKIGPRHAERLRQFNEPHVFKAWFELPYRLMARVKAAVRAGKVDGEIVNDAITALYHAVARCAPVRRGNFAPIRLDGRGMHLDLPATEGTEGHLSIPAPLTKNGKALEIPIEANFADWFRFFIRHVRQHCPGAGPDNPYLFPAANGRHRDAGYINAKFVDRNWRDGGFRLNGQLSRHISAKVILDADPSKIELVRALLGHKSVKTTESYYGQVSAVLAQRWYQETLRKMAEELNVELAA